MATPFRNPNGLRPVYIAEWLEHLKVSQTQVADWMGTDKANVTRWIGQPHRITLDVISAFADALLRREPLMADASVLLQSPEKVLRNVALRQAVIDVIEDDDEQGIVIAEKSRRMGDPKRRLPRR